MERFQVKVEEGREDLGSLANGNDSASISFTQAEGKGKSGENLKTENLSPPPIPIQGIENDARAQRSALQIVKEAPPGQQTERKRQNKRRMDPAAAKSSESGCNGDGPMKKRSLREEMKQWKSIADQAKPPVEWKEAAAKRNVTIGEPLNIRALCGESTKPGILNVATNIPGTRRVINANRRSPSRPQPPRKPVVPGTFEKISLYLARSGEKHRGCNYTKLLKLEAKNHLKVRTPTGCKPKSSPTSTATIDKPAQPEAEGAPVSIPIISNFQSNNSNPDPIESVPDAIEPFPLVQVKLEPVDNPELPDSHEEV